MNNEVKEPIRYEVLKYHSMYCGEEEIILAKKRLATKENEEKILQNLLENGFSYVVSVSYDVTYSWDSISVETDRLLSRKELIMLKEYFEKDMINPNVQILLPTGYLRSSLVRYD